MQYIHNNIQEARSSKDLWNTTKATLGWNKRSSINKITSNGQLVTDKAQISENFNNYFIEKIKTINDNIPHTTKDPLDYTRQTVQEFPNIPEFNFQRVSLKKIRKTISV